MQDNELKAFAFACIDKVAQSGVSRLSIQNGTFSITVEAGASRSEPAGETASGEQQTTQPPAAESGTVVPAPLVGTFYAASAPGEPPLAQPGDEVKQGDVLCVIEAMKIMNNIESPCDGTISRVLVSDGEMVEYHQPLFVIE